MLFDALIISLLVLSIWYTMQEGEIFGKLGHWFWAHTHKKLHPPLYECNVCMTPWYGSVIYLLWHGVTWEWPIVVITAMGLNILYNRIDHD